MRDDSWRRALVIFALIAAPTMLVALTLTKVAIVARVVGFACVGPVPLGLNGIGSSRRGFVSVRW